MLKKAAIWTVAMVTGLAGWGIAQPGGTLSLIPQERKIAEAATIPETALREVALRQAIDEGLLKSSEPVSSAVQRFLGSNSRWIDARPFEDIIRQYRPISRDGVRWVQQIEWEHLPRAIRLSACRSAIAQGQAEAPGGMIVNRYVAMQAVGVYGLAELLPLVERYYPALSQEAQLALSLPRLRIKADLKDGCTDSEDCAERAAGRLAGMADEDFRNKMESDKDFAEVLFGRGLNPGVIGYVCEQNPFNGWINPGCGEIHKIYDRQVALDKKIKAEQAAEGIEPPTRKAWWKWKGTWLDELRGVSYYDPKTRPPK